jgi:hypothetical protein
MSKKWVICLGAGESQVSLIKNAQLLGYSVLAIDRNPNAPGFEYADEIMIESTHNADSIIDKIKGRKWYGLLARCTGEALFTAANIVKEHNILGVNYELANIATSKSAMRKFSLENNIRAPYGVRVSNSGEFNRKEFKDIIIIKPDFTKIGKKSITKVHSSNIQKVNQSIELALSASGNEFVEVEDFIEGFDSSYLSWIENGSSSILLSWDELIGYDENSNLFQYGVSTPSISLETEQSKKIKKILDDFAKIFPNVRTLLSFSFRIDKQGIPWLIEVHADMTGDLILDQLAPVATKCDFLLEITKLFLDQNSTLNSISTNSPTAKPTALLYKNNLENNDKNLEVTKADIISLHHEIDLLLSDANLEQKKVLVRKGKF